MRGSYLAAAFVALITLAFLATTALAGCSSGPQLPVTTTPMSVSCVWNCGDGGTCEDCDCLIDRSSAESAAHTTGNDVGPVDVSPETTVRASALPEGP